MIEIKRIKILRNYVLVKPDEKYETFQRSGKETDIIAPDFIYDNKGKRAMVEERNFSVKGTVYAIPQKLVFDVKKALKIERSNTITVKINGKHQVNDFGLMDKVGRMRKNSLLYDTDIELEVGDRVYFSYTAHMTAKENGMFIDTDQGKMMLMKYDDICMTIDKNNKPLKMINGYILVEPDNFQIDEAEGVETINSGGIVLVNLKSKEKRRRKKMAGTVIASGNPVRGYKNFEHEQDSDVTIEKGDRIIFDPRTARELEMMYHQEMSEKFLYLLHRKDIYLNSSENPNFEDIKIDKLLL